MKFTGNEADAYNDLVASIATATARQDVLEVPGGVWHVPHEHDRPAIRVTCTIRGAPGARFVFSSDNPGLYAHLKIDDAQNIGLSGLILEGDKKQQPWATPSAWCILSVTRSANIRLKSLTVTSAQKWGIDASGIGGLSLEQVTVSDCGYAEEPPDNQPLPSCGGMRMTQAAGRSEHVTIAQSDFIGNGGQGLNLSGIDGLLLSSVFASENGLYQAHGNQDGVALSNINTARLTNCHIRENLADGLVITNSGGGAGFITVRGGSLSENGGNGALLYILDEPGVINAVALGGVGISNNSRMSAYPYPHGFDGVRLSPWGSTGKISNIRVAHCTIDGDHQSGVAQLPREIDPAGRLGAVTLKGNHIGGTRHKPVDLWSLA